MKEDGLVGDGRRPFGAEGLTVQGEVVRLNWGSTPAGRRHATLIRSIGVHDVNCAESSRLEKKVILFRSGEHLGTPDPLVGHDFILNGI